MGRLADLVLNVCLSATLAGCAATAQQQSTPDKPYLREEIQVPFSMRSSYGVKATLWGYDRDSDGHLDDNEVDQVSPPKISISEALRLRSTSRQNGPGYR